MVKLRLVVGLTVLVGLGVGSAVGGVRAPQVATHVRATLVSPASPGALGVLVARLDGTRLSWRLTFHGLAAPVGAAHVHLGKPGSSSAVAATLCAPCTSGLARTTVLRPSLAAALRSRRAYVDVHAGATSLRGAIALGTVPTLQLVLVDGQSLHLPAAVHYTVTGLRVGVGGGKIALLEEGATQPVPLELGNDGVFYLPDDKTLSGKRDLTFVLVDANGATLRNPEARVTVYGLLLAGRRSR